MNLFSYNIHKGVGGRDRRYRLERIIRVIEEGQADVICLQEVDRGVRRTRFDDQPKILAEHFRFAAALYQQNVVLKSGGYGNLILSRWPLRSQHQISLRLGRRKPRGAQIVVIDTPEGLVHLVHWHLGLAERERHWQVKRLLEHRLFRDSAHLPTLIVGDSNDWRNSLRKAIFSRHGFIQVTSPPSRYRTFPAFFPLGALDKAYARGTIDIQSARIIRTPLARVASDHLPLALDFRLGCPSP